MMTPSPALHQAPFARTPPPIKWRRRTIIAALLGIGAVVWVVSVYNRVPKIVTPIRPPVPSPNGFDALKAAGAKMVRRDEVMNVVSPTSIKNGNLNQMRELVRANKPALDAARSALQLPYVEVNDYPTAKQAYRHFGSFRDLARLFSLSGYVAWKEGKQRESVDDYLSAVTIGRRMPHRTVLINELVGIACEAIGRYPLWGYVEQMDIDTATHCLNRLQRLQEELLPFAVTLEEESYFGQHAILESFEKPELLTTDEDVEADGSKTFHPIELYAKVVPKAWVLDTHRAYMNGLIAKAKQPYPISKADPPLPNELITASTVPVYSGARTAYVVNETGDVLLRTALALRVYCLRTGNYPAALPDLVAVKILPAVPNDPFAMPGEPLRYKPLSGGKYLLYSIGPDSRDDKGKAIKRTDDAGRTVRLVNASSTGDIVAGWFPY